MARGNGGFVLYNECVCVRLTMCVCAIGDLVALF